MVAASRWRLVVGGCLVGEKKSPAGGRAISDGLGLGDPGRFALDRSRRDPASSGQPDLPEPAMSAAIVALRGGVRPA